MCLTDVFLSVFEQFSQCCRLLPILGWQGRLCQTVVKVLRVATGPCRSASLSLTRIERKAIIALPSTTAKFFSSLQLAHGDFVTDSTSALTSASQQNTPKVLKSFKNKLSKIPGEFFFSKNFLIKKKRKT